MNALFGLKKIKVVAIVSAGLMVWSQAGIAQVEAGPPGPPPADPQAAQQAAPPLAPAQLDNMVAPVALYPDPLLGQVLAASTYPLEIVEAQRWLQQNRGLQGQQLIDAARAQNWDPSVTALVAFPDVLALLNNDIRWTTDLGNAFLSQQADVMAAVQRMRARAQANGKLQTNQNEIVSTETQNGQAAIQIEPANPQVIYVPVYQPAYVWGPPVYGAYPDLWYPPGYGFGFGWLPGIYMTSFFPGWYGWGGWGWGLGWGGGGLFINAGFFNRWHFPYYSGWHAGAGGRTWWAHNPEHRMSVAYPNRAVASRFGSNHYVGSRYAGGGGPGARFGNNRNAFTGAGRQFNGTNAFRPGQMNNGARGFNPGQANRMAPSFSQPRQNFAPGQNFNRPNFTQPRQNFTAPRQNFSMPRQNFSAPRPSFSQPHFSAPRSFGGGGGHFGGGGGGHFGGGGGGHFGGGGGGHFGGGGGGRRR